jgi:FkbM family methyltransferase
MSKLSAGAIVSRQKGWKIASWFLKARLMRMLTGDAMEVFLRGNDVISLSPMISGEHEPHMTDFFRVCSQEGFDDFFIDIGANIGLTSYQVAADFKKFYAFEPNPLAFSILQVNVASSPYESKFTLYNFGIGDTDGELDLFIPKKNWGGAFVNSSGNAYGADVLAAKDNFSAIDPENYVVRKVAIRSGANALSPVFSDLIAQGSKRGVIKIDVEGFELSVVRAIAQTIPAELQAYIIFENWDADANLDEFLEAFHGRAEALKLERNDAGRRNRSKLAKIARYAAGLPFGASDFVYRIAPIERRDEVAIGDIVLRVSAI